MTEYCEFCQRNLEAYAKRCWNCKRVFDHDDYVHFGRPDKDPSIEPFTMVRLSDDYKETSKGIFGVDDRFLFVHEISNMPGHVFVIGIKTGKNYIGFHEENFVELSDEEL